MKQTLFLNTILQYYRENDIQIGDPNEGSWEMAHTPLPRSMGNSTQLLLKEHHIIHDLYQSEELGKGYFWVGNVKKFLYESNDFPFDWFHLCEIYEELKPTILVNMGAGFDWASEKQLRAWSKKGHETCRKKSIGVYNKETGRRGGKASFEAKKGVFSPENLGKGCKITNSQKWRCLVTGKISTPGPLTLFQKSKGIDTSLREKVE